MKALLFRKSVPRYLMLRLLSRRSRGALARRLWPVSLTEVAPPRLPTPRWVRIAPKLSGICGSDLSTICASGSPFLAPLISMPFVLGHEVVGTVIETGVEVSTAREGDRVVVQPALGCVARGITEACDACRRGQGALCRNVTRGDIAPGIQIGYCRDTGGGMGQCLVAHQSQVYQVPPEVPDRAAVLVEPFACAVHAVLKQRPADDQTALVLGCGSIGLLTIAAVRASGSRCRIVACAKHDHQKETARLLGADLILDPAGSTTSRYHAWAEALHATVLSAELGKPTVVGGADVTFDCVASSQTIDDGLRFTRSGGHFVLVGMPAVPVGVDWTPMWYKELTVHASYAYGPEYAPERETRDEPVDSFRLAIQWMTSWKDRLTKLVGPPFALEDYREALRIALDSGRAGSAKTVFEIR